MARPRTEKSTWIPVGARIPPALRDRLLNKHKNNGDLSKLIHTLLQKYIDGKIFGVKIEV